MKTCTKCKVSKPFSEFRKAHDKKDGHQSHCKQCKNEYALQNKERLAAGQAAYYQANKEKVKARVGAYQKANKAKIAAYRARYYAENEQADAERKAYKARWYQEDFARNPQKWIENCRKYYERNKDLVNARAMQWKAANPEARRVWSAKRRAAKKAGGSYTVNDVKELLALQKNKCPICRTSLDSGYHVDHVVPIANGGRNTKDNLQILCPPCNLKKNKKDPIDFMQSNGFLL